MRRFEFVEGTSAKFWMGDVEGSNFVVVFGRLGTAGQRKEKPFPDEKAARRELEKKIAEKVREGYAEVGAAGAPGAPPVPAPAAAEPYKLALPARTPAPRATPERLAAAVAALVALEAEVGNRSWVVALRARRARRALQLLGGVDPGAYPSLRPVFESLMALVGAPRGARRLPLRLAMDVLGGLDTAAFTRALEVWKAAPAGAPAAPGVNVLAQQVAALGEPELALRVGALLADRPDRGGGAEAGWERRWRALRPHLEGYLASRGVVLREYVRGIDKAADAHVGRRVARMAAK